MSKIKNPGVLFFSKYIFKKSLTYRSTLVFAVVIYNPCRGNLFIKMLENGFFGHFYKHFFM
jgi:hypothetical protein